MACRIRIVLLPEADAGQFKRKSLVAWLLAKPDLKSPLCIVPSPQSGQSRSVIVIEVGGALGAGLSNPDDLLPPFFREELPDFCVVIRKGGLRPEGECGKDEDEKYREDRGSRIEDRGSKIAAPRIRRFSILGP